MLLQRSGRFCRLLLSAVPVIIPWSGHFQQHPSAALPSDRRGITEIIPYNQDSFPRGTLGKKAPSTVCSFLAASCLSSLSVFPAIRAGRRAPLLSPSDWTQLNSFLSLMFFFSDVQPSPVTALFKTFPKSEIKKLVVCIPRCRMTAALVETFNLSRYRDLASLQFFFFFFFLHLRNKCVKVVDIKIPTEDIEFHRFLW